MLQAVYPDIRRAIRNRIASFVGEVPALLLEPLLSYQSVTRLGRWPSQMTPVRGLAQYSGPVLIIGGSDDRFTPAAETREMYEAAREPKSPWLADGFDHGAISDIRTPEYREKLAGFLAGTIGSP